MRQLFIAERIALGYMSDKISSPRSSEFYSLIRLGHSVLGSGHEPAGDDAQRIYCVLCLLSGQREWEIGPGQSSKLLIWSFTITRRRKQARTYYLVEECTISGEAEGQSMEDGVCSCVLYWASLHLESIVESARADKSVSQPDQARASVVQHPPCVFFGDETCRL